LGDGRRARVWSAAGLLALLVLSLALRLYGINWDQGGLFHPDERAVLMRVNDLRWPAPSEAGGLLDPAASPLNPHWFNYGSLPIYALKVVQSAAAPFAKLDLFDLRIPGRAISALADTATVALVFLLASRWYGRRVGSIAGVLSALAVIQIQLAHFFAFDGLMTTFIVAGVFFSVRVAREGRSRDSALAGLMFGFGFATKFSIAPLALTIAAAHAVYAFSAPGESFSLSGLRSAEAAQRQWRAYRGLLLAGAVALAAMLLAQPYMLLDYKTFLANLSEQSRMVRREIDLPYTRQYIETPRYWYQAWQFGVWGVGPVAGVTLWLGFFACAAVAAAGRRKTDLVVLSWVLPYLLITGWFEVKFLRYMLPVAPFMAIFGARLLAWAGEGLRTFWPSRRWLIYVPAALVLLPTAHYALAFVSMYSGPHPAQSVSKWLDDNARTGALVAQEHWEEGIPSTPKVRYPKDRLPIYDPDTPRKFDQIAADLAASDYLVLYSNRLYATVPRLENRYPVTTRLYEKLFKGSLGYELAYVAQKERSFLGVTYSDDPFARIRDRVPPPAGWTPVNGPVLTLDFGWADESFTVYEHPVSFVFENRKKLSAAELLVAVGGFEAQPPAATVRQPGLLLTPEESDAQQGGGTWRETFFLRKAPETVKWLVWLVAAQAMAFAALPLSLTLFRALPDRGYLLAKPLGVLLAATVAWLLASLGWVKFSFWSVLMGVGVTGAFSAVAWRAQKEEIRAFLSQRRRYVIFAEALFIAAFLSFLAIRAANPDLWHPYRGGEKPMDFAYLNAVVRSSVMPPYDPWFSGGYLNYYYFGQFIVASMVRITGVETSVAYNLAVPLLFALTAGAAFSIVYNLAELTQRARGLPAMSTKSPYLAGVAALVLVTVAGNIDGLVQVAQNILGAEPGAVSPLRFDYWRSSRMMPPDPPGYEITEFPFFTFLFADLHAHLIAIPFALLALGVMLALFVRAGQKRPLTETLSLLAVLGVVTGALRTINTWDYPTAMMLAVLLVGGGELLHRLETSWRALAVAAGKLALVVTVGYVAFLPFHSRFELFNNGFVAAETQTALWQYLAVHSIFLAALGGWLAFEWRDTGMEGRRVFARALAHYGLDRYALIGGGIVLGALVIALAVTGLSTVAFAIAAAIAAAVTTGLALSRRSPRSGYAVPALSMVLAALVIGAMVDIVTVKGDIGRMNTVFKFYLHAWALFALASAYVLWLLGVNGKLSLRRMSLPRGLWLGCLVVLAAGVLIYPVLGTQARIKDRFDTSWASLDGMRYMKTAGHFEGGRLLSLAHDYEAIRWLQETVDGSPVIIEGLTDLYHWGNRVSIYTGLPAVIGWDWHQRQQRVDYEWAVTERREEVDLFYRTASEDVALDIIRRYGVKYVYVGELESVTYPAEGLAKFQRMAASGLRPVYRNDKVTVYEYTPVNTGVAARP
jgi:YYY domain-containing protein